MGSAQLFQVTFQVVKLGAGENSSAYKYRRESRTAIVQAASIHPKDLLTVLNNDITLGAGESIEILAANQYSRGTEGIGTILS
jgi:hypothetical protein